MPGSDPKCVGILDRFSSAYPVSGEAVFTKPFTLEYKWEKYGRGDLLILAHPLHLHLLSNATVLEDFKYKSIDGDLVGIVGDLWELKSHNISVTWHSIGGVKQASYPEIVYALRRDVKALRSTPITTESSYFYGKLVARAARLALIAEEVDCLDGNTWRTPLRHGWMVLLVGMLFCMILNGVDLSPNKDQLIAVQILGLEFIMITIIILDILFMVFQCLQRLIVHGGANTSLKLTLLQQISSTWATNRIQTIQS